MRLSDDNLRVTVQLPSFSYVSVTTTVSVPDGGTVLLGGIKRLSEGRNEFGVPILDKIPYLNRLFQNVAMGRTDAKPDDDGHPANHYPRGGAETRRHANAVAKDSRRIWSWGDSSTVTPTREISTIHPCVLIVLPVPSPSCPPSRRRLFFLSGWAQNGCEPLTINRSP